MPMKLISHNIRTLNHLCNKLQYYYKNSTNSNFKLKITKQMQQQKAKIQRQLKVLRQESVQDYLSQKLDSLASKQVVNDILHQFLNNHDQQFLSNIANSIAAVKIQCKQLKNQLRLKQQKYQEYQANLKNQVKNEFQTKNQTLLNQWTMLQILCEQKFHQRNPRKAVEKAIEHLGQTLVKNQILQKSIKQFEQITTKLNENRKKQLEQIIFENKSIHQKLQKQNKQLHKKIQIIDSDSQKLLSKFLQSQKNNQTLQQKIKGTQIQYKQSHQLLQFLQNKVCEMKQSAIRAKYELQLVKKDKETYQIQMARLKSQNLSLDKQILDCRSQLVLNSTKFSQCQRELQNLKDNWEKERNISNSQIKNLSEQIIYLKKQNLMQRAQIQTEKTLKNQGLKKYQELLKNYQKKTIQRDQLKKIISTKQNTFKTYVLQKDQQIKIVQEQLHVLRAELDQSEQRETQYQEYLLQLNELRSKLKKLQPSYQQSDFQINEENKFLRQKSQLPKIRNRKTKMYYMYKSLKTKIQNLKNEIIEVKQKNKHELQSFRNYVTNMINFLLQKSNEQKIICSYCQHKSYYQKNMKVKTREVQQERIEKQMQKTTKFKNQFNLAHDRYRQQQNLYNHQKHTTTKWSKHIRNLNQKFKAIDSENKQYKLHLNSILNEQK